MRYLSSVITLAVALAVPLLFGCAGNQSTMEYYQLAPTELQVAYNVEKMPDLALGVGPITVPEILKRQEIVVRGKGNQYLLDDHHRWAGLLDKDLTMVLIENLSNQLGTDQVVRFPWGSYFNPEYRVFLDVLDLTGTLGGQVELRASWAIIDQSSEKIVVQKISGYELQAGGNSYNALVQAKNDLIALLSLDISSSLRDLEKQ